VWTGDEMIIWGGNGSLYGWLPLDTGGRYHPSTDTWIPTSTIGAPAAGFRHSAVWSGTRMFVWGGSLNTAGRYLPHRDVWGPIATQGGPEPTASHVAVWADEFMIVWGGTRGPVGGRYFFDASPDNDSDGFCAFQDCDDTNDQIWATPGEVTGLVFTGPMTLNWDAPATPGGSTPFYDTLRSSDPTDFVAATVCVEEDDGTDTEAEDTDSPALGGVFYYLVRAENSCPVGEGSLGIGFDGTPRTGRGCP
jgi:hypothetical protein